jgi:threonine-phosphate decarboxylase
MEMMKKQKADKSKDKFSQGSGVRSQGSECDHGGNVYKAARDLGIPESRIIDFSASINPLGISGKIKAAITRNFDGLVHYPDPDAGDFRRAVSRLYAADPETILPGNGSTELIYLLPRALKPESVLVTSPTFSEYERACKLSHELQVMSYKLQQEDNFRIKPDEFISAMTGTLPDLSEKPVNSLPVTRHSSQLCDMAFLCNPNNPTGHALQRKDVLKIADAAREINCVLVVDEAFIDFIPEYSVTEYAKDYPNVIVLRSLTKFYALTGLRIGYGVASKEFIERIKEFKEPWTVNNLAQTAAITALDDKAYIEETREIIAQEKECLENAFKEMGIMFLPSSVNFYLLKIDRAGDIVSKLRGKGILVRSCSNFRGLDDSYIRVAVRSHEHNEILLKELAEL